ncbi:hypothetical protein [Streptomyces sp. CAI-85]|uniref:hypothetical protein n=1 Tax=Streptomyces sp. CAI-85 TaxID=1472662 RepID=UPI00158722DD|nr:hypothetical protein [Streptomyces sp. CAI-85]NUV64302.1 hypothetical protein [Streptomyces sp. CAI-85]
MVKNHARKNAARGRSASTGETHRKAVDAVRHDQAADLTAVCTPNSHPGEDGRVEHGYQLNVLDAELRIVATVDLPEWESFRPSSAGHRLIEHGYMIRPDARGPETVNGWRQASPGLDSWSVPVVRTDGDADGGDGLVLVVDHPRPDLGGAAPCPECAGTAVSGAWFSQPSDGGRPPLAVPSACPGCWGCGRAEHDDCVPSAHVTDDPDDGFEDDYLDEFDDDRDDGAERCPSCGGRGFNVVQTTPADEPEDGPEVELRDLAASKGASMWEVMQAAAFRDLDALLGEGAQTLADRAARAQIYLLFPCGCAEDRVRTVRRDELGGAA